MSQGATAASYASSRMVRKSGAPVGRSELAVISAGRPMGNATISEV
jgi:hypothetical protein